MRISSYAKRRSLLAHIIGGTKFINLLTLPPNDVQYFLIKFARIKCRLPDCSEEITQN